MGSTPIRGTNINYSDKFGTVADVSNKTETAATVCASNIKDVHDEQEKVRGTEVHSPLGGAQNLSLGSLTIYFIIKYII